MHTGMVYAGLHEHILVYTGSYWLILGRVSELGTQAPLCWSSRCVILVYTGTRCSTLAYIGLYESKLVYTGLYKSKLVYTGDYWAVRMTCRGTLRCRIASYTGIYWLALVYNGLG